MTAASGIAVFIARMCLPTEPQEAPCRVVTFLIERHWDPSIDPTSVRVVAGVAVFDGICF